MARQGELVFTTLTKEALPMIRYRTRDLTALLPPTARAMRRMAKITGRSDDMLIIRGVNVFPSQIEELVLKLAGLAPHYQLEVSRAGASRSAAGARRVPDAAHAGDPQQRAQLQAVPAGHHQGAGGRSRRGVAVEPPGALERSAGKAKRVIESRPR